MSELFVHGTDRGSGTAPSTSAIAGCWIAGATWVLFVVFLGAISSNDPDAVGLGWLHLASIVITLVCSSFGLVATRSHRIPRLSGRRYAVIGLVAMLLLVGAWFWVAWAGMHAWGPLSD